MAMLRTDKIDMADPINESDIADFLTNAAWAVCSTFHTVLKTSPGAAIFGRDMLFDIPFLADWSKIGEYKQLQYGLGLSTRGLMYLSLKTVSSAKAKDGMKVNLGQSHQLIQMAK